MITVRCAPTYTRRGWYVWLWRYK